MKKASILFSIFCFSFLIACNPSVKKDELQQLNGYWEIKKVQKENEKPRVYKFNETVDFIKLDKNLEGFRKKVNPKLDGSFTTTKDKEKLEISMQNDSVYLHYRTEMDDWKEALIHLEEDKFTVENQKGIRYTYKRFKGYLDDEI